MLQLPNSWLLIVLRDGKNLKAAKSYLKKSQEKSNSSLQKVPFSILKIPFCNFRSFQLYILFFYSDSKCKSSVNDLKLINANFEQQIPAKRNLSSDIYTFFNLKFFVLDKNFDIKTDLKLRFIAIIQTPSNIISTLSTVFLFLLYLSVIEHRLGWLVFLCYCPNDHLKSISDINYEVIVVAEFNYH